MSSRCGMNCSVRAEPTTRLPALERRRPSTAVRLMPMPLSFAQAVAGLTGLHPAQDVGVARARTGSPRTGSGHDRRDGDSVVVMSSPCCCG